MIDKGSAGMMAAGAGSRSGSHSDTDWSDFYNLRGNLAQMKAINRLLSDPENTDFLNSLTGGSVFGNTSSGMSGSAAGLAGYGF